MFRKLSENYDLVFQLPTLKLVINAIESNDKDGDTLYQDQKVNYYLHQKKKIHTESRPGNDNYDMVTCTLVEEKLK